MCGSVVDVGRPAPAVSHRMSDRLHLWAWRTKQVFKTKTTTMYKPDQDEDRGCWSESPEPGLVSEVWMNLGWSVPAEIRGSDIQTWRYKRPTTTLWNAKEEEEHVWNQEDGRWAESRPKLNRVSGVWGGGKRSNTWNNSRGRIKLDVKLICKLWDATEYKSQSAVVEDLILNYCTLWYFILLLYYV